MPEKKFKPNELTVDDKEKTIHYTYINRYGRECTATFGYVFVRGLIRQYLIEQGVIASEKHPNIE